MTKILTIFGTRPEAIKLAPVIQALAARDEAVATRVCVTAQHRGMLDQMLVDFSVRPDHDLDVMTDGQSPTQVAARVLERLEPVLLEERPDWVLVQGDTTTTLAAAMAAKYARARIAHVEAGLRTFDQNQPFPEEINRQAVSRLADQHFAPTPNAKANLVRECVDPHSVLVTGNTGIDALRCTLSTLDLKVNGHPWDLIPGDRRVVLVTAHRRENLGAPLEEICRAMRTIAEQYGEAVHVFYPVHPNHAVRETAYEFLGDLPNVGLLEPLDYPLLVRLMLRADVVITDSGGLQEEGPYLGKPVLVLRNVTERPEAVAAGAARLVGNARERIVTESARLLDSAAAYAEMARPSTLFGDGHAAERIVKALLGEPVEDWAPDGSVPDAPTLDMIQGRP